MRFHVGHAGPSWQGATLVVETVGVHNVMRPIGPPDGSLSDPAREPGPAMWPAGNQLRIVERIRLKDRNTMQIDMTYHDETVYARPHTATHSFQRLPDRQSSLVGQACTVDSAYLADWSNGCHESVR